MKSIGNAQVLEMAHPDKDEPLNAGYGLPSRVADETEPGFAYVTPAMDLLLILLLSVVLRLIFFCGYGIGDDPGYAFEVNTVLTEGYHDIGPLAVFLLRPVTLWAIAASIWLFGWSESAFVLPIFIASLIGIGSTYVLGHQLYGRGAAILSACMLSLFPLDLVNSTTLTNDILGSSFLGLGAATMLHALRGAHRNRIPTAILGGILIGLSTAVKINFLIIIIPLTISLILASARSAVSRKAAGLVIAGWVSAQIALSLFCWVKANDPLAFITFEMDFNRGMMERHYRPELLSETLLFYPRMMFRFDESGYGYDIFPLGWFFVFAFGALILAMTLRMKDIGLPAGWFLFLLFAMQFWPLQWDPYVPIHRLPRFLHIAAIPGALVIGATLSRSLGRGRFSRAAVFAAIAIYAVASIVHARRASAHHNDCMEDPRLLAGFVDWYDGPVFTDPELSYYLQFSKGFSNTDRFRMPLVPYEQIWDGSLVIVGGSRKPELASNYAATPAPIPSEWIRLFQLKTPIGRCRSESAIAYMAKKRAAKITR